MKNLKIFVDKLNELPKGLLSKTLRKSDLNYRDWKYKSGEGHPINGIYPYDRARRIAIKNIGKSFDEAFSYFCKQVPKYQQKYFLELFERKNYRYYEKWTVDKNGNIQYFERYKKQKSVFFKSDDYKTELVHKITGHKKEEFHKVYSMKEVTWRGRTSMERDKLLYYEYGSNPYKMKPLNERYIAYESDFVPIIIEGFCYEFTSKNDPMFKRLSQDKEKSKKAKQRKYQKQKQIEWEIKLHEDFMRDKEKRKKEREENLMKIIKHGFDPVTSFRTEKQTNSDLIHLKQ